MTLIIQIVVFLRLYRQWRKFPTSVQEKFLRVIRSDIMIKSERAGKKIRVEKEMAYDAPEEEFDEYFQSLDAALENIDHTWELDGSDGSATEVDTGDELEPTRIDGIGDPEKETEGLDGEEEGEEEEGEEDEGEEDDSQEDDGEENGEN